MVWIKARFQVSPEGHYATTWISFSDTDWTKSVGKFRAFAWGYEAATSGMKCSLEALETYVPKTDTLMFILPRDNFDLSRYLDRMQQPNRKDSE